jgi:hypothetical protein
VARDSWMEGPNVRRTTEDVNRHGANGAHPALVARVGIRILGRKNCLPRPRNCLLRPGIVCFSKDLFAPAKDLLAPARICLLRPGSCCSGQDLFAPAGDLLAPARESAAGAGNSMLRLVDVCSPPGIAPSPSRIADATRDSVGSAGETLPPRRVRPLGVGSRLLCAGIRLLGNPSVRSGHGPAPSPLESLAPRGVRHLRRSARLLGRPAARVGVEDAGGGIRPPASGSGLSPPALDLSARRSIRWLPGPDSSSREPIRRIRSPARRGGGHARSDSRPGMGWPE